ncbi:MAG TPA: Ig-like domain-containing protein, partial [Anaerolineaceae bacterium]
MINHILRMFSRYWILSLTLLLVVAVASGVLLWLGLHRAHVTNNGQPIPKTQVDNGVSTGGIVSIGSNPTTLDLHLSEGKPQPQAAGLLPVANGDPLPADQTDQLLSRLPTLPVDPNAQTQFKLPQGPIPPPRTGETVQQSFPPQVQVTPDSSGTTSNGPLKVLRFAPEGEIPIAPFVSVTFNQPMVAVATLADLSALQSPVKMEPALPGTWRWLGTRTLNFQYDSTQIDRLPKATQYKVTIPAGTKSASGGVLDQQVVWTFTTPPPKIVATYPSSSDPQPLDPLFFISFDQRIDPVAVLATIHVTAGSQTGSLSLLNEAQVQEDKQGKAMLQNAGQGRWIAFRAKEPLPGGATINVSIGPGTPSA